MWAEKYLGWYGVCDNTSNCWDFVEFVMRVEFGVKLPSYTQGTLDEVSLVIQQEKMAEKWQCVEAPQSGDLVLMTVGGRKPHIGIMVSGMHMLHYKSVEIGSAIEAVNSLWWRNHINGFYRFKG
jgi:cell wall-associated NlpC family hydrolase